MPLGHIQPKCGIQQLVQTELRKYHNSVHHLDLHNDYLGSNNSVSLYLSMARLQTEASPFLL